MSAPRKEQLAEGVTLWLGDCMEVLPMVGPVAAVVTDPPYLGLKGGMVNRRYGGVSEKRIISTTVADPWGASLDWVPLVEACATKAVAVFCSHSFIADLRTAFKLDAVSLAVWHKVNAAPAVANVPRQTTEFIWLFRAGPNARWRSITDTLFSVNSANAGCVSNGERFVESDGRATHPTQKPVRIMEPFVSLVDAEESVCDPFAGTSSTGIACINLGRHFVGIERDLKYFDLSCRRLSEALRHPRLPFEEPRKIVQEALPL